MITLTSHSTWARKSTAGKRKPGSMVLACHRDVYCDMLRQIIEQTYDQAIRDHNQGFIPL
jgi:hypothetical protein